MSSTPSTPSRARSVLLIGVLAAVCAMLLGAVPAAAATPRPTTTSPAKGAAGWLAQQFTDHYDYAGGSYFDGGSTADSIYALAAAKVGKTKIHAAITYFAKNVEKYVDIKNADGYGPNDGGIGKTAVAAMVAGADPTHFGGYNLLKHLKDDECSAGSTKCTPGAAANIYSSVSESFAILAEARGAKKYGTQYAPDAAALQYFLSLQCANGGFTSQTTGGAKCASDPDSTGLAMMALQATGTQQAALARAAHWLTSVRNADGSWTAQHVHNVDSTGLAAAALAAQGADTKRSIAWLESQQVRTGPTVGKGASRGALKYHGSFDASSSIKATADGILGMVPHGSLATLSASTAAADTPVLALAPAKVARRPATAGRSEAVTATGFAAGETVSGMLRPAARTAGHTTADKNGTATLKFTVPASYAGRHTVTLTGRRSTLSTSASFRVRRIATSSGASAAAPSGPGPSTSTAAAPAAAPLADTGRDGRQTAAEGALGLGLIALGGITVALGRRRTSE